MAVTSPNTALTHRRMRSLVTGGAFGRSAESRDNLLSAGSLMQERYTTELKGELMKYKIHKGIEKSKIKHFVPPSFVTIVPQSWPNTCTIIVFKCGRNDVVLSNIVEDALSSEILIGQRNIIAFGGCFTIESEQLLKGKGISSVSLSNFPWTDERYKEIKGTL